MRENTRRENPRRGQRWLARRAANDWLVLGFVAWGLLVLGRSACAAETQFELRGLPRPALLHVYSAAQKQWLEPLALAENQRVTVALAGDQPYYIRAVVDGSPLNAGWINFAKQLAGLEKPGLELFSQSGKRDVAPGERYEVFEEKVEERQRTVYEHVTRSVMVRELQTDPQTGKQAEVMRPTVQTSRVARTVTEQVPVRKATSKIATEKMTVTYERLALKVQNSGPAGLLIIDEQTAPPADPPIKVEPDAAEPPPVFNPAAKGERGLRVESPADMRFLYIYAQERGEWLLPVCLHKITYLDLPGAGPYYWCVENAQRAVAESGWIKLNPPQKTATLILGERPSKRQVVAGDKYERVVYETLTKEVPYTELVEEARSREVSSIDAATGKTITRTQQYSVKVPVTKTKTVSYTVPRTILEIATEDREVEARQLALKWKTEEGPPQAVTADEKQPQPALQPPSLVGSSPLTLDKVPGSGVAPPRVHFLLEPDVRLMCLYTSEDQGWVGTEVNATTPPVMILKSDRPYYMRVQKLDGSLQDSGWVKLGPAVQQQEDLFVQCRTVVEERAIKKGDTYDHAVIEYSTEPLLKVMSQAVTWEFKLWRKHPLTTQGVSSVYKLADYDIVREPGGQVPQLRPNPESAVEDFTLKTPRLELRVARWQEQTSDRKKPPPSAKAPREPGADPVPAGGSSSLAPPAGGPSPEVPLPAVAPVPVPEATPPAPPKKK
jgi:hypothetical protein